MNDKSIGEVAGNGAYSLPAKTSINLKINDAKRQIKVASWTSLLDLTRE